MRVAKIRNPQLYSIKTLILQDGKTTEVTIPPKGHIRLPASAYTPTLQSQIDKKYLQEREVVEEEELTLPTDAE